MELRCSKCQLILDESEFANDKRLLKRNGKGYWCFSCIKLYRQSRIEITRVYRRQYYLDHTIECNKLCTIYYAEHALEIRYKRKDDYKIPYNRLMLRLSTLKRKQRGLMPLSNNLINQLKLIESEAIQLGLTVDHIVPLQGKNISGFHVPWNLQLLTSFDNKSKGNKFFPELGLALTEVNQYLLYNKEFDAWIREKIAY